MAKRLPDLSRALVALFTFLLVGWLGATFVERFLSQSLARYFEQLMTAAFGLYLVILYQDGIRVERASRVGEAMPRNTPGLSLKMVGLGVLSFGALSILSGVLIGFVVDVLGKPEGELAAQAVIKILVSVLVGLGVGIFSAGAPTQEALAAGFLFSFLDGVLFFLRGQSLRPEVSVRGYFISFLISLAMVTVLCAFGALLGKFLKRLLLARGGTRRRSS